MNYRDVETLSAYLDGQLAPSDLARMEFRLQSDVALRAILDDLRTARDLLRKLPTRRAPRNFTLTRKMVSLKPPMPRAYSGFRFATALATTLLLLTFATNVIAPRLTNTAAPAPAFGYGGGGAGPESYAPAANEAPAAEPPLQMAPAPTQTSPAEESARGLDTTPAPKIGGRETIAQDQPQEQHKKPVSVGWQVGLGLVAVVSGLIAFALNRSAVIKWRRNPK